MSKKIYVLEGSDSDIKQMDQLIHHVLNIKQNSEESSEIIKINIYKKTMNSIIATELSGIPKDTNHDIQKIYL